MGGDFRECLEADEALDFVDGIMGEDRRGEVEGHIDGCDACRRLIAAIIQSGTGPRRTDDLPPSGLAPGTAVGRYVVERLAGRGGMGVVYEAHDPELDRPVALKLLRVAPEPDEPSREAHGRLLREARALARLSHPNVVAVYDVGELGDDVYIAMELVGGTTLRGWLARGPDRRAILPVLLAAGRGLAAAHASGLVHRDVKPDNIIVGDDGRVRLVDFGLVRAAGERAEPSADSLATDSLTRTGETVGTPAYMAPEQRRGGAIDPRADQFAFCVTAWQALAGEYPFDRASAAPTLRANAGRAMPARQRRTLLRGLAVEPGDRFESMDALLAALSGERRRRRLAWAGAAVVAGLVIASIALATRGRSPAEVCGGAEGQVAAVWSPDAREATRHSFEAAGHPGGGAAFVRVSSALDGYARDWASAHTAVCRDTRVHRSRSEEVLDARMRCLEDSLSRARALIDRLRGPVDAATVERAVPAVLTLPGGASCAALVTSGPRDDTGSISSSLVGARVARADALVSLGRFADGVREAREAEALARQAGEPGARRRALLSLGRAQTRAGQYADAEKNLRELIRLAAEAADDRALAEAWVALVPALTELGRFADAVAIEAAVDAAVARIGNDAGLRARAARYQSEAYGWELEYEVAVPRAEESVALAIQAFGPRHPFVAEARANLAQLLSEVAAYERGREVIDEAIALNTELFGSEHPMTALTVAIKGRIEHLSGHYVEARELLDRAVDQISSSAGRHPILSYFYRQQGWLEMDQGNPAAARTRFELALSATRADFGPNDYRVALYLTDIAETYEAEGRFDEAFDVLTESLPIRATSRGPGHVSVGRGLERLGRIEFQRRRFGEALTLFERAMPIYQALGDTERIAVTTALIAGTAWELGVDRAANLARVREVAARLREMRSGEVEDLDAWLIDKPATR